MAPKLQLVVVVLVVLVVVVVVVAGIIITRRKANVSSYIVRRNCLLKQVIESKIEVR